MTDANCYVVKYHSECLMVYLELEKAKKHINNRVGDHSDNWDESNSHGSVWYKGNRKTAIYYIEETPIDLKVTVTT